MPRFIQRLYPERIWTLPAKKKEVFLTFDDGPIPQVTPWVLEELKQYRAKATFFCIGDNIHKHPHIFKQVVAEGHAAGNHTFNHLNGWKTPLQDYVENVDGAQNEIEKQWAEIGSYNIQDREKKLFRPPYGRITGNQAKFLRKKKYDIVMWDCLSYDFDQTLSGEACFHNVVKHLKPGSIVVFHDSLKAEKNLRHALPKVLSYIENKGWRCSSLA